MYTRLVQRKKGTNKVKPMCQLRRRCEGLCKKSPRRKETYSKVIRTIMTDCYEDPMVAAPRYIKVPREAFKLKRPNRQEDPRLTWLYVNILYYASFKKSVGYGEPGTLSCYRSNLAQWTGFTRSVVDGLLDILVDNGSQISYTSSGNGLKITVENYAKIQKLGQKNPPPEEKKEKKIPDQCQELVDLWHHITQNRDNYPDGFTGKLLPRVRGLNASRKKKIPLRLKVVPDLNDWNKAFHFLVCSPWHNGTDPKADGYRSKFDFTLQIDKIGNILEMIDDLEREGITSREACAICGGTRIYRGKKCLRCKGSGRQ